MHYIGRSKGRRKNRFREFANANGPQSNGVKKIVTRWLNGGWDFVSFGPQGSAADRVYVLNSRHRVTIDFVDLYCTGDLFRLEISRVDSSTKYILLTDDVSGDSCQTHTTDPDLAWASGLWSAGTITLPKGHYRIKIIVESTSFTGGTAAIRAYRKKKK